MTSPTHARTAQRLDLTPAETPRRASSGTASTGVRGPRRSTARLATIALVLVTAVWASSFTLIHGLVDRVPPTDLNAVRFVVAAVAMLALFGRSLRALRRRDLLAAAAIGVVYGVAQILQTIGLAHTTASMSGFLTGLCVVLTPILGAMLWRERPPAVTWAAAVVSCAGLGVLSWGGDGLRLGLGEILTLAAALAYALHILAMSRYLTPDRVTGMAVAQMLAVAAVSLLAGIADGRVVLPQGTGDWAQLLWMALVAGALAMWGQAWAQARMPATRAAIVLTLEPVFAAAFAVGVGGESLTARMLVGGGLIVAAMLLVEVVAARAEAT